MKRAHRSAHRLIWLVLAPLLAAILVFSLMVRPGLPVNEALPFDLVGEAD
jgi:hypothetical protein